MTYLGVTFYIKGLVQPKIKISPCFTHPQAIVYDFLLSDESNQSYIKKMSLLRSSAKLNKVSGCLCLYVWQLAEVRENCLKRCKYDICLTKIHRFNTGGLYTPPWSHVRHVLLWMDVLYLTFGQLKKTPAHCHYKTWKGQDNFLFNSDWIRLKEESHIHLGCHLAWLKHELI